MDIAKKSRTSRTIMEVDSLAHQRPLRQDTRQMQIRLMLANTQTILRRTSTWASNPGEVNIALSGAQEQPLLIINYKPLICQKQRDLVKVREFCGLARRDDEALTTERKATAPATPQVP